MTINKPPNLVSLAVFTALLTGCSGDAETLIIERDPIVEAPANPSPGDGNPPGGDFIIDSLGRLAVASNSEMSISVIDLDDSSMLDSFAINHEGSRIIASPDYRYVTITARNEDTVEFLDGGLWREDHVDHLHDYEQAPSMSDYTLNGSRPTHVSPFDGQMAVFYDGDADAGIPASVQVVSDGDIIDENNELPTLNYSMNMHGVAKAHGEMLLSTIRREDSESTSNAKILPDQIGIYHWHDDEYELEQVLTDVCPDLHGSAVNETHFAFGCGDGVVVAHQHEDEFESVKIANLDNMDGLRVGTLYGHKHSELFLGIASSRATGQLMLLSINPQTESMETLEWEQGEGVRPIAYGFSFEGDYLAVLDDQGGVSKFELHLHDGEREFEFDSRIVIAEGDLSAMPENHSFTMTLAQNANHLYVADPIGQHVIQVDLDAMSIEGEFELSVVPSSIVWLGIKEDEHDH